MNKCDYKGWSAVKLATGNVELIVPCEVGPRVVYCGRPGGQNLFAEYPGQAGGKGEDNWCIRGGHRLWHSPEHPQRTYVPDNSPIACSGDDCNLVLDQAPEAGTGMVKQIRIEVINANTFRVTHSLTNQGAWPVECAAWALTVMAHGGYAVIPFLDKESHEGNLLPKYHIVPWTYTDFSAPAWDFQRDYIGVEVSRSVKPQKLGLSNYPGWSAYWQEAGTFIKYSSVDTGATYPDFGSAFETFHCDWMIELETLSPLVTLNPGQTIKHVEYWGVLENLPRFDTAAVYHSALLPAVTEWLKPIQALTNH